MSNGIVRQVQKAIETESLAEFVREYVNGNNGNLSIRGLSGMCGIQHTALVRGGDLRSAALAAKLAAHGFEGGDLVLNGFPPSATWLVIEYYAYESKAKAPYAKAIARTFGAYGVKAAFSDSVKDEPSAVQNSPLSEKIDETKAILGLIDSAMQGVKLGSTEAETQNLLAGMRLSLIGDRLPQLRSATMEAHKLLAATTTTEEIWLTPTSIGKELGVSARTVNTLLIDAGFQTRVPKEDRVKGEPDYRPTEKGDRYSSNTLATGNSGDSTTYQHVKWAASVVGILREFMSAIAS
jgi:hypothetical protein